MMSRTLHLLPLLVIAGTVRAAAASGAGNNVTDGPHSCGGVHVPYPFGIVDDKGNVDFRKGFEVLCDAGHPGLATTGGNGKPVNISNFSIEKAEASVRLPVAWQCYNSSGKRNGSDGYTETSLQQFNGQGVYRISHARNYFFVLGCATVGLLQGKPRPFAGEKNSSYTQLAGCASYCEDSNSAMSGACSGVGCCHADIPPDLVDNFVYFRDIIIADGAHTVQFSPCDYAFMAEKDSYNFNTTDLNMDLHRNPRLMPVRIDWAIRDYLTCKEARKKEGYACISSNSRCLNATNGPGYICNCRKGYEGNPYIRDGCSDINECERPDHYPCQGNCVNTPGSYDCICPKNSKSSNAKTISCNQIFPLKWRVIIGALVVLLITAIMVFVFLLTREKRKIKDYYRKNGGPILEKFSTLRLYKKEDIRKIQKSCNIIGQGGFGKVYKGCIGNDTRVVAVKAPINVSSENNDQFANEISIQSQVSHKNIVKLLGCCVEVDSPILVYEFVPKGSLADILHGDKSMPLSLRQRLQIAAGSAEGLAYMHSKANATILHGDVKPANILINDDYIPKISDFGISRLMASDKEHVALVIGDKSYMDPVYFQTGLLTNKCDVYSFGVVLLELITREKASHSNQNELLRKFNEAYKKEKSVIGLVDKELVVDSQLLGSFTEMIRECLCLDVNERPDMTDLEERLHDMVKRFPTTK